MLLAIRDICKPLMLGELSKALWAFPDCCSGYTVCGLVAVQSLLCLTRFLLGSWAQLILVIPFGIVLDGPTQFSSVVLVDVVSTGPDFAVDIYFAAVQISHYITLL